METAFQFNSIQIFARATLINYHVGARDEHSLTWSPGGGLQEKKSQRVVQFNFEMGSARDPGGIAQVHLWSAFK